MKGLKFGNLHSYEDFSLYLKSKEIGSAEVKTEYVEVLGGHGKLDFTEVFGEPKYSNRLLTFVFSTIETGTDWASTYTKILNELHGLKKNIVLDDDPDYYYVGRITVSKYASSKRIGTITIECDCEPFKYKVKKTVVAKAINGSATVDFYNARKSVAPSFTTSAPITIMHNGNTYAIEGEGTFNDIGIVFTKGINTLTFTGTATVTVEYQEGDL